MKLIRTLILTLLLIPALVACGGSPVTFDSIPTPPEATVLQAGQNSMADTVAESMKGAVGDKLKSEIKLYQLPAGTDWASIKEFYNGQLGSSDWKSASEMNNESEAFNTTGWQRGSFNKEQVLMVGYMPALLGNPPVLIVSLFSE